MRPPEAERRRPERTEVKALSTQTKKNGRALRPAASPAGQDRPRPGVRPADLDPAKLPQHVAILLGEAGAEALRELSTVAEACAELGVPWLTLCAGSQACAELEGQEAELTAYARSLGVRLRLLHGGGRDEILQAARRIAAEVRQGLLDPKAVDGRLIQRYVGDGAPDPDLVVCTGGRSSLDGFLVWQLAYAELYLSEASAARFDRAELLAALRSYQSRERRFGKVAATAAASATPAQAPLSKVG
jgi:undecaprenyl pyrophosphate synthase